MCREGVVVDQRFLMKHGAKHSSYLKIWRPGEGLVLAPCRADVIFGHVCQILTDQSAPDQDGAPYILWINLVRLAHPEISARGGR